MQLEQVRLVRGTVTSYAARTGTAQVESEEGTHSLFTGAFFSGLPVRHPREGDRVDMRVEDGVVTLAHLVRSE